MSELKRAIMERDDLTSAEADELISEARQRVRDGDDPQEVLLEEFGLEPDYFLDLID